MTTSANDILSYIKSKIVVTTVDLQRHFQIGYSSLCRLLDCISDKLFHTGMLYAIKSNMRINYLDFLNSEDVKAHLKSLKYRLTPQEKAFVIYTSRKRSLAKKHTALLTLAQTIEECVTITTDSKTNTQIPLSRYLLDLIRTEQVYLTAFHSHSATRSAPEEQFVNLDNGEIIRASFSQNGRMTSISLCGAGKERVSAPLFSENINIPTPFKSGDIVKVYYDLTGSAQQICVFLNQETSSSFLKASAVYFGQDGAVYEDVIYNYIDVEYCREDKKEIENISKDVISWVKMVNGFVIPALSEYTKNN